MLMRLILIATFQYFVIGIGWCGSADTPKSESRCYRGLLADTLLHTPSDRSDCGPPWRGPDHSAMTDTSQLPADSCAPGSRDGVSGAAPTYAADHASTSPPPVGYKDFEVIKPISRGAFGKVTTDNHVVPVPLCRSSLIRLHVHLTHTRAGTITHALLLCCGCGSFVEC